MARWFEEGYEPQEGNPVEDLKQVVEEAKTYRENTLLIPGEQKEMFESSAQKARAIGIYVPPLKAVWKKVMTIEEYKAQPFKYDGNSNPVPISEIWGLLTRRQRKEIATLVKKGKNPDITKYI